MSHFRPQNGSIKLPTPYKKHVHPEIINIARKHHVHQDANFENKCISPLFQ